jgi:peptide/nickel transport system substrate-binding protein
MFGYVTRVYVSGSREVRFEFETPMPPFFLSLVAMFSASIVSPKALARGKEFVARNPVGTGAFRFVSWENQEITLDANPAWYEPRPKLDRLVLRVVPDPRTARLLLEQGQVQGIDTVASRDVVPIGSDPRLKLHKVSPGLSVCYLSMNNDVKPFDDVRVRQAVAFALDKARIVKAAYEGQAAAISTLVPKGMEGYVDIPDRVRDVAKAKALLKEAGVSGMSVRLHYMGNPRPYVPDPDALAAQIRDDLRDAGLDVVLKKEEWAAHLPLMQNGEHQLGILGWSPDVADADNYLHVLLDKENTVKGAANNVSFYRGEAFHQLVAKARTSYDPSERNRLYAEAARIAFDEVPLVPLIAMPRMAATLSKVTGFVLDPISSPRFAWVSLAE